MKFKIELDIPAQRIADIFTSAIESGDPVTRGWCAGIYWRNKEATPPPGNWYYEASTYEDEKFQLEIDEIDEKRGKQTITKHMIKLSDIEKGIAVMAKKFGGHFSDWMKENDDAATADVFLQCVVFGEEKYA